MNLLASASQKEMSNQIILVFEVIALIVSLLMIVVGLIQNKSSQTGLSALNGGNDELFSNSKERGTDKTMSIWMFSLGIILFVVTIVIGIITNTILK
ncbi:preprotein translocase subunit SecG [Spiroplasma turonicum]|uniref:Protein-export membrane protein SecG n=1 Tax=Spiroplasma turonicum TaxID=216946 RepID=A0A0K1P5W9_9MOLU|nr:preprotein translocase subunit SecG [Spiroplasma turonicum]AKU79317.1 preprotein translocase subunit SecG [Spiroplasma turonicum]ALX70340.1 preprotein translocase subunit SecG [Spiroplasma turonicum]